MYRHASPMLMIRYSFGHRLAVAGTGAIIIHQVFVQPGGRASHRRHIYVQCKDNDSTHHVRHRSIRSFNQQRATRVRPCRHGYQHRRTSHRPQQTMNSKNADDDHAVQQAARRRYLTNNDRRGTATTLNDRTRVTMYDVRLRHTCVAIGAFIGADRPPDHWQHIIIGAAPMPPPPPPPPLRARAHVRGAPGQAGHAILPLDELPPLPRPPRISPMIRNIWR